jgi:hypothetical protein
MGQFWIRRIVIVILASLLTTSVGEACGSWRAAEPDPGPGSFIGAQGKSPLHFEPNVGQADSEVRFLARGQGYGLYLTPTEAVLSLHSGKQATADVLRLRLTGANRVPVVAGEEPLPGKSNYFIGSDPSKWRRGVPHYGRVAFRETYPGISVTYYGNQRQLEYDFVVSPGADPHRIRFDFAGADAIRLDQAGNLVLSTRAGQVLQKRPLAYQEVAGIRTPVECHYELGRRYEVGFAVGAYDRQRPLVIDPLLVYATYLGGSAVDGPRAIAVDDSGAVYLTGYTGTPIGAPFPTTAGAYQTTYAGGDHDVFVTKLHPGGEGEADLVYSTYLGGSSDDIGWGIAVDALGAAYIVGETSSAGLGFPTTPGAFQTSSVDTRDAFFVKLDASGGLAYATYLGGGSIDEAKGVAVDASGIAYVTGISSSTAATGPFPTTAGAYQTTNAGSYDAFMVKLNPQGSGASDLLYSTLFGGPSTDFSQKVKLHGSSVYIAGYSVGIGTLPTTPGAYQASNAGAEDAFLAVFNPAGLGAADLAYATYLGGAKSDICLGLAVDASGMAFLGGYLEGYTNSADERAFPTTPGAYQTSMGAILEDAFVAKINPAGAGLSDLVYSTYVGGPSNDFGLDLTIDDAGTVYLTGAAGPSYPTTPTAYQTTNAGEFDAFATRLNPAGHGSADLLYSTYFGGSGNDFGQAIALDGSGLANVAGETFGEIPTTAGAFQTASAGSIDGFLARLSMRPPSGIFLHGSGAVANPPTLFLDRTAPTAVNPKYSETNAMKFSGGNPWVVFGTWFGAPGVTTGTLFIDELDVWLGRKNGNGNEDDVRFDVRAEVMKNGTPIAVGEVLCLQGLVRDPSGAKAVKVSFAPVPPVVFDGATDVLSLRLLSRLGTDGAAHSCGGHTSSVGARVYFDALTTPAALSTTQD